MRVQSTSVPERFRPYVEATDELARRFTEAGRALYLVGGSVRDALLPGAGTEESDIDLTTDARPEEIERIVRGWADDVWTQGARFGTIGCRKDGRVYEITTHRAEVYVPEPRRSSGSCAAGPTTSGRRAPASGPSDAGRTVASTRSRRTGQRSTCPSRGDRADRARLGRRRLDAGRPLRDHRMPEGRSRLRDHDAPGRGLRARV